MNAFEKWQVVNGAVANMLLLGTLLAAIYIGFKQNEISNRQTKINQQLLDIEYDLSVDLNYDKQKKCFVLSNRSRHNIYYSGTRFGGSGPLETVPRQLMPGGTIEIYRVQTYDQLAGSEGGVQENVEVFLIDDQKQKYILHVEVSAQNRDGVLSVIDVKKGAPEKANW